MVPKLQRVKVGDIFPWMSTADDDFVVKAVDPEHALALGGEAGSRYSITWRQSATGMLPPLPHLSELAEPEAPLSRGLWSQQAYYAAAASGRPTAVSSSTSM